MGMQERLTTVISTKGQLILPRAIRDQRHWTPGTRLTVKEMPDGVLLTATPLSLKLRSMRFSGPCGTPIRRCRSMRWTLPLRTEAKRRARD